MPAGPGDRLRTGLILAGGASSRFGGPKAFASFAGRPMIRWVAEALAGRTDELIVSVADSQQAARVARLLPRTAQVVDAVADRGPIEGVRRGFEAARGSLVLVAPCDAPLLRPELYDLLLAVLGSHDAAAPRLRVFDPVRAVFRRRAVLEVLRDAGGNVRSPSALVDRLDVAFAGPARVREVDPELLSFLDLNTPRDFERAERRVSSSADPRSVPA